MTPTTPLVGLGLVLALAPLPARGDDTEALTLPPLEIAATHAGENAPVAVTAWSGSFLEDQGIDDVAGLAPYMPGLFTAQKSPSNTVINIRGITSDSGDGRGDSRVGVFQDGVYIGRQRTSNIALFDMESVELLPGPQPTLFARGAEAGVLSYTQNKPVDATEGSLTAGFGNYNALTTRGVFNTPLVPGELFARFAFSYTERDGYTDNVADGSDLNGQQTLALRGSLRWQPGGADGRTTIDLIGNWQHDTPSATGFKSNLIPPTGGDTSPFTFAELNRGRDLTVDRTVQGVTGIVTHRINPDWTLTSTTGWREYDSRDDYDADGSRINLIELTDRADGRQFSQEFRVNYDAGGKFAGFAGVGYFYENNKQRMTLHTDERAAWPFLSGRFRDTLVAAGVPAALVNAAIPTMDPTVPVDRLPASLALFNNPALPPSLQALALLANAPLNPDNPESYIVTGRTHALDLVLDGTWRATDRLSFTAGVRGTWEDIASGYEVVDAPAPSLIGIPLGTSPNTIFAPTDGRIEAGDRVWSWAGRVAVDYEIARPVHTWASVSRGRRPPGFMIDADATTPFAEEEVWSYEIGLRGSLWRERVQWSASVFYYNYSHFQSVAIDSASGLRLTVQDAGSATGKGAEFSVQGSLTDRISLFAVASFNDTTFDKTGEGGEPQAYAGFSTRLTPKYAFSLGATGVLPVDGYGLFFVSPVWQYRAGYYFNDDNSLFDYSLHQGGFGLVNVRAGWRSPQRRWEVLLYVDNLFDKNYLVDAGNLGAIYGLPTFVAAPPRMYGMQVTLRF
ncbi:TonB-denpendent receptor [Opitutaceae bacterium TAV5]|nr:TonB-denpendent receptor [Opitutaceae bacterium TAV5]